MTKLEYDKLKAEIIEKTGKPEYDMGDAVNDSAKELQALRTRYMLAKRQETRANNNLRKAVESVEIDKADYKQKPAVEIALTETDLKPFTEIEREVIITYFDNTNLTARELHKKHGSISTRAITALLKSGPFAVLHDKVFNYIAPMMAKNSILKAMRDGDSRITLRVAEHFKVLANEESTININQPITDLDVIEKLKKLGDESI